MRMMSLGEWRPVAAAARLSARCAKGKHGGFPIKPRSRHRGPKTDKGWPTLLARATEKMGSSASAKSARHQNKYQALRNSIELLQGLTATPAARSPEGCGFSVSGQASQSLAGDSGRCRTSKGSDREPRRPTRLQPPRRRSRAPRPPRPPCQPASNNGQAGPAAPGARAVNIAIDVAVGVLVDVAIHVSVDVVRAVAIGALEVSAMRDVAASIEVAAISFDDARLRPAAPPPPRCIRHRCGGDLRRRVRREHERGDRRPSPWWRSPLRISRWLGLRAAKQNSVAIAIPLPIAPNLAWRFPVPAR